MTKNGRDYVVVIISAADLEAIEATLELLADPAAQERIAQGRREIEVGWERTGARSSGSFDRPAVMSLITVEL